MKFLIFKKYCKVISSIQILKCKIANFILICQHFSFPLAIIPTILVWHRFKNRGDLKIGKGLKMQIRSSVRKIINYIPHIFEIPNIDLCFRVYTEKCCILTLIEQKNYHFLAVTENLWFLELVLESITTPIRIPKIK